MAKIVSKGTVLEVAISAVDTTIAQVIGIAIGQSMTGTYDSTDLSTGVGKTFAPTGYAEQGDITADIFYDPAAATHIFLKSVIDSPLTLLPLDSGIVMADGSTTELSFSAAGIGMGATFDMNDGVKGNLTFKCTGLIGFP